MYLIQTAIPRQKAVWGLKRIIVTAALLLVGLAPNASAEGRHQRTAPKVRPGAGNAFVKRDKMDADVAKRAGGLNRLGTADVIVTLEKGADLPDSFKRYSHNGKLDVIHGYVLDGVPVSLLSTLANHGEHAPRARQSQGAQVRCPLVVRGERQRGRRGQRDQQPEPLRLHRRRRHGRLHRFGHHLVSASRPRRRPRPRLRRLRQPERHALRRQRARHARRRHRRRHGHALGEEVCGHRAGRLARVAQGAEPGRRGLGRQHSQSARLGLQERRAVRHPRRQHVGRRVGHRVLLHGPADAGDQDARGRRHHRRRRRRQLRQERRGTAAVGRRCGARQRAVGAHGLRVQHGRHLRRGGRQSRGLQLVGSDRDRLHRQAGHLRAGRRHRVDGRAGQLAVSTPASSRRRRG